MQRNEDHAEDCFANDPWPASCTCGAAQRNAAARAQQHPVKPHRMRTLLGAPLSRWKVKPAAPAK